MQPLTTILQKNRTAEEKKKSKQNNSFLWLFRATAVFLGDRLQNATLYEV